MIVERRVLGGYSLREISQQTGWGLSRCKHFSSSALSKLRGTLAAPDPGGDREQ
jgi:DNA-directed RNA polymerase specialized sigma24 family protein